MEPQAARFFGWFVAVLLAVAPAIAEDASAPGDVPHGDKALAAGAPVADAAIATAGDVSKAEASAPEAAPAAKTASRVRVELDARGELFAPAGRDAEPVREPIIVSARFDFLERQAAVRDAVARRDYREARAEVRVADRSTAVALPSDAREIEVALRGTTPTPYLSDAFLAHEEAELLDTPFDSLLLDGLLPGDPVAVGASWTVPADATAGMLAIDTLESGGLEAALTGVEAGVATVRLTGIIDGAVDGVPTHLIVEGECTATATAGDDGTAPWRLTNMRAVAVVIRERRQASHVAPGFDIEARVGVARRPAVATDEDEPGAGPAAAPAERRRGTGRPGLVWHRDRDAGYDLVCDTRWRVVEDAPTGLVMRLVDRGALVGQCSLTMLPTGDALAPPTIAEVQRDIERSLAGQFARFEQASEATRSDGVRIVRVVSAGTAENLPFRWIHHVLTDATGRRAAATFMLEASAAGRFAAADREFVDGLAFPADSATPGSASGAPEERAARVPRETLTP